MKETIISFLVVMVLLSACAWRQPPLQIDDAQLQNLLRVPPPDPELMQRFHADVVGDSLTIQKDTLEIRGFKTGNQEFLQQVLMPALSSHRRHLEQLPIEESIGFLALFTHQVYKNYLGHRIYRWGGDLLDLDDPQQRVVRHDRRYGLDCSGFVAAPYELAVMLGLMREDEPGALFSSKGFARYCQENDVADRGGRFGTANQYRLDTIDLAYLGREIFTIPRGGRPTRQQMKMLQPGDIVGRAGHFGIIVRIKGQLYYLESGGWVVPKHDYLPYRADKALDIFARPGAISIRRALPDRGKVHD